MFFDERFHSVHFKKSNILNLIWFLQAMWFAIALFTIPLYLFEIFQSWEIVWRINSIAAWFWIITILLISVLLWKFSRWTIFKISILFIFLSLSLFVIFSNFFEALWARTFLAIWWTTLWSVLSLYLKSIAENEHENIEKDQWRFQVSKNIAWFIWPIWAWFLFNYIEQNKEFILEKFNFLPDFLYNPIFWDWKYLEYNALLYIALFFIVSTFIIFLWAKFVNNHPHLQTQKNEKETNKHHHFVNFKFIWEYFQNKYRTLSFLNILFLTIWFSTFYWFWFTIFLENANLPKTEIWLFFWLAMLPLAVFEWFIEKIIKKSWWTINSLILWYSITILFLILWIIFWRENIYIFITFFILAHIWISISEPLQELQYFEWTNKEQEAKFYSIYMIWWWLFRLFTPFLFWIWITAFWIENTFYSGPFILSIFLIWLITYKVRFEK